MWHVIVLIPDHCLSIYFTFILYHVSWNSAIGNIDSLERDGLRLAEFCPRNFVANYRNETFIPDPPQLWLYMSTVNPRLVIANVIYSGAYIKRGNE